MSTSEEIASNAKVATKNLLSEMNHMGCDEQIQDAMFEAIQNSHNTVQQCFWRNIMKVAEKYSKMEYSDGRNEASVELCKKVTSVSEEHHLPFV